MICLDYLSRQPYLDLLKSIIVNQYNNQKDILLPLLIYGQVEVKSEVRAYSL